MTAGIENKYRNIFDKEIREALNEENLELYEQLTGSLIMQNPDRGEMISQNAAYLQRIVKGISICKKDEQANNGGCTEPHISHVLSARLSSRPLAWSETTLKHLAPILAAGNLTLKHRSTENEQPVALRKAAARASKAFLRATEGLPSPNSIGMSISSDTYLLTFFVHYVFYYSISLYSAMSYCNKPQFCDILPESLRVFS